LRPARRICRPWWRLTGRPICCADGEWIGRLGGLQGSLTPQGSDGIWETASLAGHDRDKKVRVAQILEGDSAGKGGEFGDGVFPKTLNRGGFRDPRGHAQMQANTLQARAYCLHLRAIRRDLARHARACRVKRPHTCEQNPEFHAAYRSACQTPTEACGDTCHEHETTGLARAC
jgi:hypothetical protein